MEASACLSPAVKTLQWSPHVVRLKAPANVIAGKLRISMSSKRREVFVIFRRYFGRRESRGARDRSCLF